MAVAQSSAPSPISGAPGQDFPGLPEFFVWTACCHAANSPDFFDGLCQEYTDGLKASSPALGALQQLGGHYCVLQVFFFFFKSF